MNQNILLPIQYLRGIAALMVVWYHGIYLFPNLSQYLPSSFGEAGVAIFFVLSGFVMVATTSRKNISPREFFIRRIKRVVPLYWLMTIIASVALLLRSPTDISPTKILQSLLFIPHFSLKHPKEIWPVLIPGWTLNYEMFFYVMFAGSLIIKKYYFATITIFLLTCVAVGELIGPFVNPIVKTYTNPLLLEFILGMALCHLWVSGKIKFSLITSLFAIFAGIFLITLPEVPWMKDYNLLVGSSLLVFGSLNERILTWRNSFLLAIGDASYSIYLTQVFTIPVVYWLWHFKLQLNNIDLAASILFMFLALLCSILVGIFTYRKIEMPMINRMKGAHNIKINTQ